MNWRHKMALEAFARKGPDFTFHGCGGVGEKTFKWAIKEQWIESINPLSGRPWWDQEYRLTDAGRAALAASAPDAPEGRALGWGRGMFIGGAAAGVTPDRKTKKEG